MKPLKDLFSGKHANFYAEQTFGIQGTYEEYSLTDIISIIANLYKYIKNLEERIAFLEKKAENKASTEYFISFIQEEANILQKIEGIGNSKSQILLNHFGSLENIRKASIDELIRVKGINNKLANRIANFL